MDIQAEKLTLVQAILDIDDLNVIKKVKKLLKKEEHDWIDNLSDEQRRDLFIAIEEADRGEGIPHEEAVKILGL